MLPLLLGRIVAVGGVVPNHPYVHEGVPLVPKGYPFHTDPRPNDVCDTLDMACRLYPAWPSHSLEHVATRLNVANGAEHRALSDARLVKDIFLAMLKDIPTVKTIADVMRVSQPLSFADTPVCAIEGPPGFEVLATAIAERCTITIVYDRRSPRPGPRTMTPRGVLEVHGVAYVVALRHQDGYEKTYRLDRIRACWLRDEEEMRAGRILPSRFP